MTSISCLILLQKLSMCDIMASSSAIDTPCPASLVIKEEIPFLGDTEGPDREALLGFDLIKNAESNFWYCFKVLHFKIKILK